MNTQTVTSLNPNQILADQNIRFGLKKERIASMAESIKDRGRVLQSIEVEPLDPPINGKKYRVTDGHYRHAASLLLNETENAGIMLPVLVVSPVNPADRLRTQLAANLESEDMSPMDKANAIKKAQELNIPTSEIREMFGTPGGRKGSAKQPASNSFVNMMVSFLDLPKSIQGKIHSGLIGVSAAYELTKISKNENLTKEEAKAKQEEIVADCETEREKEQERVDKDEERFLKSQAKSEAQIAKEREAEERIAKDKEAIELAEHAMITARQAAEEKTKLAAELYAKKMEAAMADADTRKKAEEAHKAADADAKEAQNRFRGAQATHIKMAARLEPPKKVEKDRTKPAIPATKAAKPISPSEVKASAAKVGATSTSGTLNAAQMRKVVEELKLPGHVKVKAIGEALSQCFDGKIDGQKLYSLLAEITGEKKGVAVPKK